LEIDLVKGKQEGLKLNLTHMFMVCADIYLLGKMNTLKENTRFISC